MSTNIIQSWELDGGLDSLLLYMLGREESGPISIFTGMHGACPDPKIPGLLLVRCQLASKDVNTGPKSMGSL